MLALVKMTDKGQVMANDRFQGHRADLVGPGVHVRRGAIAGGGWRAAALVALLLISSASPFLASASAYQTLYSGNPSIGSNSTIDSTGLSVLDTGFSIPANATITDGWLNLSTGWDMDGGNGTWFEAGVHNQNLTMGSNDMTSTSHFQNKLSLAPDQDVGWVDDLETLRLQFNGFSSSSHVWSVSALNFTNANGSTPNSVPEGLLLAAATSQGGLPPGTNEWMQTDSIDLPNVVSNYSLHFEHWLSVDDDDGAWVEASLDNGSWQQIEPVGGHSESLENGTPAFVGNNASAWEHSEFPLDQQLGLDSLRNASSIRFRFNIMTTAHSQERPGWFIDAINLTNSGEPTNSWFHGNPNGAYAANADGAIVVTANTSGMSAPLDLEMWVDWDIEGANNDNLNVEGSLDGNNWTTLSASPGIPGTGMYIDGIWYYAESNGFKRVVIPILSTFANQSQIWLRFRVTTDSQVNGGYGISGWEGLYIDDPTLHSNQFQPNHKEMLLDNFTSNNSVTPHSPTNASQQWQHVTNHGHNGPTWLAFGFEDSPLWPDDWSVEIETGNRGWAFGNYPGHGPMTGFPSGSTGAGIEFSGKYLPNMWTHLITPSMHIPENASARLAFQHWMCAEPNWDGGAVYLSTDDGATWNHFGQNLSNFYDTNSTVNPFSPLYLKGIFDGSLVPSGCFNAHPFTIKRADVSHLAGQDVRFRFSFFSDTYVEEWGWYLDDVGIEVDYFETEGTWTSPLIEADDWGYGLLDVRGKIPAGTSVRGSILSSTDEVLIENMSLPLNLQSINWSAHPNIRVRLHLSTDDPYLTPVIDKITIGADVHLNQQSLSEGWNRGDASNYDQVIWNSANERWEVNGSRNGYIWFMFPDHRPIKEMELWCDCSGAYLSVGQNSQLISSPTTIFHQDKKMGSLNAGLTITAGGWVKSFDLRSRYHGITDDPTIDVGDDIDDNGTNSIQRGQNEYPEWAWPSESIHPIGHHGLQSIISHAEITEDGLTTKYDLNSQSASMVIEDGLINFSAYLPVSADIDSYQFSVDLTYLGSDLNNSSISGAWDGFDNGQPQGGVLTNVWGMLMHGPKVNFSIPQSLEFQEFRYLYNATGKWRVDVHRMMFSYDLMENISLDPTDMAEILFEQSMSQNSTMVDIPVNFSAERGSVHIDGAVEWLHLIENEITEVPVAMVPDGSVYHAVTKHRHLDNLTFTDIELMMSPIRAPASSEVLMRIVDPDSESPTYEQPLGQGFVEWDIANTTVTRTDEYWEVEWVWSTTWLWDDNPLIHFMTEAHDAVSTDLGPAVQTVGFSAGNAVENDLELVNIKVSDQYGRDISDVLDPHHPWPVSAGSEVSISGQIRFEGSVASWVPIGEAQIDLILQQGNFSQSTILDIGEEGEWSAVVTLPESDDELSVGEIMSLKAYLHDAGPTNLPEGLIEDATTGLRGAEFRWDGLGPELGIMYAMTPSGDQPADGHVWNLEIPLALGLQVLDDHALGDELTLHYWRQAFEDDGDGIAQESEYQELVVQLNLGANEFIEFPFIDVDNSLGTSVVSLYVTCNDLAGVELEGGGSHGLDNDLATVTLMFDSETLIEPVDLTMQRYEEQYLLPGQEHRFSFVVEDLNGLNSLDVIYFDLTGEGDCLIEFRPWKDGAMNWDEDCFILEPQSIIDDRFPEYEVHIDFIISWSAISILGENEFIPSFRIEDQGADLGLGLTNLEWLNWSLYDELELALISWTDLVPSFGTLIEDTLYLAPGDIIDIEWGIVHSGSGIRALYIPNGTESTARILGGLTQMETEAELVGNETGFAQFAFRTDDFPNLLGNLVIGISGMDEYTFQELDITIRLDDDSPRIQFHSNSLTRIRSDTLDEIQVSFTVTDDNGMPEEDLTLYWKFQRNGLSITGAAGELQVNHVSGEIYHDVLNLSETLEGIELRGSDDIIVWVEGRDLSGNKIIGPGSEYEPRRPLWEFIDFSPEITYISVDPRLPKLGEMITIDVQIQNTGTLEGYTRMLLMKQVDGEMVVLSTTEEFRLLPGLSAQYFFEHEIGNLGDQQLYIGIEGEDSLSPIPLGIVRDSLIDDSASGADMKWALGGLIIIVCIFLIFMLVRSQLHFDVDDDEIWETDDAETDAKVELVAQIPPPRPMGLDMSNEEE